MNVKEKNTTLFSGERKPDVFSNNPKLDTALERYNKRMEGQERFPLRINRNTVIYVAKEKCTPEYAAQYLERIKNNCPPPGGLW